MSASEVVASASIEALLRDVASRLSNIEHRLEEISNTVPNLLAMAGDVLDERAAQLGDVDERMREALSLMERVSRPETLRTLSAAVELLEQAPNAVAILGDSLEEVLGAASEETPIDETLHGLVQTAKRGLVLLASPELRALLDSPMFERGMLETLARISRAVVDTTRQGVEPIGIWGALHLMSKGPVRTALGFALGVAARLGSTLDQVRPMTAALPAAGERGGKSS